ncbi:MAG: hypothetical protein ACERKV_09895 [Clostridiaceae bacterium]
MVQYNELMNVASNCSGYQSIFGGFSSKIGDLEGKSCINCKNFIDEKCTKNLFEDVLNSIETT